MLEKKLEQETWAGFLPTSQYRPSFKRYGDFTMQDCLSSYSFIKAYLTLGIIIKLHPDWPTYIVRI